VTAAPRVAPDWPEALAVRRYVWMRNAQGGQALGNEQITVPLTAEVYDRFLRPLAREPLTFEEHTRAYPQVQYLALVRLHGEDWKLRGGLAGFGETADDVTPVPQVPAWVREVASLTSAEALAHRRQDG
jgi:hypothetical protein